tara:strand:- start:3648 stop:4052 length:405 start_codon:yes stop_codon:yes gene_type:complete
MAYTYTVSPKLPLVSDNKFGFAMNVTLSESVSQNLKCLLLTAPGERVMDPEFGVGLNKYLFQNVGPQVVKNIKIDIRQQVSKYMPFVNIRDVKIRFGDMLVENPDSTMQNKMFIKIDYTIRSFGVSDTLVVSVG